MKLSRPQNYTAQERAPFILDAPHLGVFCWGSRIYTITLGTSGATRTLYQQFASGPGYYFHALTASALRGAFREIGTQLGNLRLEQ